MHEVYWNRGAICTLTGTTLEVSHHPYLPCHGESCSSDEQRPVDQLCVLQLRSSESTCRDITKVGGVLVERSLQLAKMIVRKNKS